MSEITPAQIEDTFKSPSPRPVANLSNALNYYFGKYNVTGYHIVNILIHLIAGILLFIFLKTTLELSNSELNSRHSIHQLPITIAFFAAMIWLVHPVNTESVTYIVQRMNSMVAMFYLLAFICYIKGRIAQRASLTIDNHRGLSRITPWLWFTGCMISGILAMGSKQNAATLPAFIFLYEWFFFQDLRRIWSKKWILRVGCIAILICFIAVIYLKTGAKVFSLYSAWGFTLSQRLLAETRVVIYYLSLFFNPSVSRLSLIHDYPLSHSAIAPPTTLLSIFSIIAVLYLSVYLAKKDRLVSFCILWFFGNLVIESSFIPLAPIFEHRTYLPYMLVTLLFVLLVFKYVEKEWLASSLLCMAAVSLSVWTYQRNITWQDKVTFWTDCVEKAPHIPGLYSNLGLALQEDGKTNIAIDMYHKGLQINPNAPLLYANLASAQLKQGKTEKAIYYLKKGLQVDPDNSFLDVNLGNALLKQGKTEKAVYYLKHAQKISPNDIRVLNTLGNAMIQQNKPDQAISYYTKAIELAPNDILIKGS